MATPDIKVVKLKIRRGSNSDRKTVVLEQGELGYTTDTKRVFVGDGATLGGVPVGPRLGDNVLVPTQLTTISTASRELHDIVRVGSSTNGRVAYQLRGSDPTVNSNWELFTHTPDDLYLELPLGGTGLRFGKLTIKANSIDGTRLNMPALSSTSIALSSNNRLVVNYDTNQFTISGSRLSMNLGGVKPLHISKQTISSGLTGGEGEPISVHIDPSTLGFDGGGRLTVINTPVTGIGYQDLGEGFDIDPLTEVVSTKVTGVDSRTFALCAGLVTWLGVDFTSPIASLTGDDITIPDYNGYPGQTDSNTFTLTEIDAITDTGVVTLSSGGFLVFNGNSYTGMRKFAIPVFNLPITY
jgi:hypothetical protein